MEEVYRPLSLNKAPIVFTRRRTSELIKYAANAFLAMKITYINEMADLCENVGADVQQVARGIGLDNRIGRSEEHTSELQSLMRNSYAVFCLKKQKKKHTKPHTQQHHEQETDAHNKGTVQNTTNAL